MTTTTIDRATAPTVVPSRERAVPAPIPFTRVAAVELRKMFDTRSGFWLMASIAILAVLATAATIIFAPEDEHTYETFATAIGFPMSVVLPMIAVLSVTSEWSQRSALTTFTLVPHRGRVIAAKAVVTVVIGAASMVLAAAVGALGNVVGTAISGAETTWNVSVTEFAYIVLGNEIGMAIGFMLGLLFRNSPGAIVGYFVYSLVLPGVSGALMSTQEWFRDNGGWLDFNYASMQLFEGQMSGQDWAQLAVTSVPWLIIPTIVGLRLVLRSEVK